MSTASTPLKIGQVHALLRRDHPNLELSKIRYYEEMGLVAPARSRKGYRLYSERDVECLREAIRLADEEFVPLRVIRVRLIEQGLLKDERPALPASRPAARVSPAKVVSMPVPAPALPARSLTPVPDADRPDDPARAESVASVVDLTSIASAPEPLTAAQLLDASQVSPDILNKILSLALVTPVTRGRESLYSTDDIALVRVAATLLRDGADPRILGALRRVVEREVGIVADLAAVATLKGDEAEVEAVRRGIAHDVEELRSLLFARSLGEVFHP